MNRSANSSSNQSKKKGFTEFEIAAQQWRLQQKQQLVPIAESTKETSRDERRKRDHRDRSRSRSRSRHQKSKRDRSRDHKHKDSKKEKKKRSDKPLSRSPPRVRERHSHRHFESSPPRNVTERGGRESPTYSPYRGNTVPASNGDENDDELRRIEARRRKRMLSKSRSRTPDKEFHRSRSASRSRSSSSESSRGDVDSSWGHDKFSKVSVRLVYLSDIHTSRLI